jgi:hypothetical protein
MVGLFGWRVVRGVDGDDGVRDVTGCCVDLVFWVREAL